MEFGHVYDGLGDIDFTLPPDSELTKKALGTFDTSDTQQVYVGALKWGVKAWLGLVYPKKTPDSEFLKLYAQNFNCIEMGATFYEILTPELIYSRFAAKVADSPSFKFCPKFPQNITHIRRLTNADASTAKFYQSLAAFGTQLGPLILQLGDNFSPKSFPQLKAYLEALPKTYQVSLEVRNKEWYADQQYHNDLFGLLHKLNIAWVISDTPGRRDCVHMELPSPHAIVRFVGNNLDHTDYSRMDAWVERFKAWKEQGLQSIWFFMHQHEERCVPEACTYLIDKLNEVLGTQLKTPGIIKDGVV